MDPARHSFLDLRTPILAELFLESIDREELRNLARLKVCHGYSGWFFTSFIFHVLDLYHNGTCVGLENLR